MDEIEFFQQRIFQLAEKHRSKLAISINFEEWSYSRLILEANNIEDLLLKRGVQRYSKVALISFQFNSTIASFLALQKTNATTCLINPLISKRDC
jgi:long-subunit acyl-CoA synthetase (AMP-forming)